MIRPVSCPNVLTRGRKNNAKYHTVPTQKMPAKMWMRRKATMRTFIRSRSPSVPQRSAVLQRVADAFLRLRGAEQAEERLAFEVVQVLLGDLGAVRDVPAAHHEREFLTDELVVLGDVPGGPHQVEIGVDRGAPPLAAAAHGQADRR